MRRGLALALLVAGTTLGGRGADVGEGVDAIARRGIERVYNLEFEPAEEDFQTLVRMNPHDPTGYFFLAMVDWLTPRAAAMACWPLCVVKASDRMAFS